MATPLLALAGPDPFRNSFATGDGGMKIEIWAGAADGLYSGTIERAGNTVVFFANRDPKGPDRLIGRFEDSGRTLPLEMTLGKARLTVTLADVKSTLALVAEAPFAGKFSDSNLVIELAASADGYAGTFILGQQRFPALAHSNGASLDGTFESAGKTYAFSGALAGDGLTVTSGNKTYALKRLAAQPANPLDTPSLAGSPATAAGASARDADAAPAGYQIAASIDSGQSLLTEKPNADSIQTALESTIPDLARFCGDRPVIRSSYREIKHPEVAGATFSAQFQGHPIRGWVPARGRRSEGRSGIRAC